MTSPLPPWAFGRQAPRLAMAGYEPIPVTLPRQGDPNAGKKPAMEKWEKGCPSERWPEFRAYGVGLLTRDLPTIDIDTMDQAIGDALQELVDRHIGDAPVRYGEAPRRAMPFRLAGPRFGKVHIKWRPIPGTPDVGRPKEPGVEIQSNGQQFVAFGIHPGTLRPYWWERDPDLMIPRGLLPQLDEATARRFIEVVAAFVRDIGGELIGFRRPEEPDTVTVDQLINTRRPPRPDTPEVERIAAALDQLGNPDVHYDDWVRIGLAIKAALGDQGLPLWSAWSAKSSKNSPKTTAAKWRTFRPTAIGAGSIFYLLKGPPS